jgi:hypothetical protein
LNFSLEARAFLGLFGKGGIQAWVGIGRR